MKIWSSSPYDCLFFTWTTPQTDGELMDSLMLISSVWAASKGAAFVTNVAHNLNRFPGVGDLVLPKPISSVPASCSSNFFIEWMALSPWKFIHLWYAKGGNRMCLQHSSLSSTTSPRLCLCPSSTRFSSESVAQQLSYKIQSLIPYFLLQSLCYLVVPPVQEICPLGTHDILI